MTALEFSVLVIPALVVGVMALSLFVMTVRRHPLVGVLALANVFAELSVALPWLDVLPHWTGCLTYFLGLPGPLFLLFAGLLIMRSKEVRRRKCLLVLSFGGFGLGAVHTVFLLMVISALSKMP